MNAAQIASSPAPARRQRTRRGHAGDYASTQQQIMDAAFRLHREGGMAALSMRALAGTLGFSAMGLYRYYESKAAVLQAMWQVVLSQAVACTSLAASQGPTARARLTASIEAFLGYWETHPDQFALVYMTPETLAPSPQAGLQQTEAYLQALRHGQTVLLDFIHEVGGDPERLTEARDLRMAMMVGYLHARLANQRFAWGSFDALRAHTVRAIVLGIEACIRPPGAPAPTAPR